MDTVPPETIKEQLLILLNDYKDFNSAPIGTQSVPGAVEFAKQVSKGYPCIYRAYEKTLNRRGEIASTWTDPSLLECAAFTWTENDLVNLVPDPVEVAITPNGRADDLHNVDGCTDGAVFLSPATIKITIRELLDKLNASAANLTASHATTDDHNHKYKSDPVFYLQSQNSNLTTTSLFRIMKHVPANFPFAEPVLGEPEAVNIWIGDERSVTSTHRDPYENLYLVLKGSKVFTLYPPVDEATLPTKAVRTGKYDFDAETSRFSTIIDGAQHAEEPAGATYDKDQDQAGDGDGVDRHHHQRIPWVASDPLQPREEIIAQYPLYAHSSPRQVIVREGEILYLPSGWYHHVQQTCGLWENDGSRAPCIAVNYWYDMEYEGEKYIMRQLIGRLVSQMQTR